MTRNRMAASLLSLALSAIANAQSAAPAAGSQAKCSPAQIRELEQSAHAPSQFRTLAVHYGDQRASYLEKAACAKKEWQRRSQDVTGVSAKYPRPVDSARNLYEYYIWKASVAEQLQARYSKLGEISSPVNAQ